MKVLIACEYSGIIRNAFSRYGYDAWSCDILPTEQPGNHVQGDILQILTEGWDLMIAHPPCTHLAASGARYFKQKQADGRQQAAVDFFMALANAPIKYIVIENPVGIMSTRWRKPDQIIQPYEYGHPESKKTCLWLKNLPLLTPTHILPLPERGYWDNQTPSGQNKLGPSPDRAKVRSKTYTGIAEAMAFQYSRFIEKGGGNSNV